MVARGGPKELEAGAPREPREHKDTVLWYTPRLAVQYGIRNAHAHSAPPGHLLKYLPPRYPAETQWG